MYWSLGLYLHILRDWYVFQPQPKLSDQNVVGRGLVQEDAKSKDILKEHKAYCDTGREVKVFQGETLAYVTPVCISLYLTGAYIALAVIVLASL